MSAGGQTPHLSDEALCALVSREHVIAPETGAHFLICPTCQARARELEPDKTGSIFGDIYQLDRLEDMAPLGLAVLESLSELFRKLAIQRVQTAAFVERLACSDDPESLLRDSAIDPLFLGAAVLEWAPAARQDDPRKILRLCRLAMDCLTAEPGAEQGVAERAMLAQLKAEEGNAYGILAQLVEAEASITEALDMSEDCADPLAVAFILLLASAHFNDTRRFEEAERVARRSVSLYRTYGRRKEIENAEWRLAHIPYRRGDLEEARLRLTEFLERKPQDPLCELATVAHLIRIDVMEGQAFKAGRFLGRLRELSAQVPSSEGLTIKIQWHIALVLGGTREPERGAEMLREVRQYYLDQDILFDAALATVDLAYLLLEAGKKEEAATAAAEAVEAFRAERTNYPHAFAAVRLLEEATRGERLSQNLYRDLGLFFELSQRNPQQPFRFREGKLPQ